MTLKQILNQELDKIKPDVEAQVDAALKDLSTRVVVQSAENIRKFIIGKLAGIHGNALIIGALELTVQTFDFGPYIQKGQVQIDKLAADLKKRIEGARF